MLKSPHVVRLGDSCVVHLVPGTKKHFWVLWYSCSPQKPFISSKTGSEPISYGGLRAGGQSHPQLNLNGMPSSARHLTTQILPVT